MRRIPSRARPLRTRSAAPCAGRRPASGRGGGHLHAVRVHQPARGPRAAGGSDPEHGREHRDGAPADPVWGVHSVHVHEIHDANEMSDYACETALKEGFAQSRRHHRRRRRDAVRGLREQRTCSRLRTSDRHQRGTIMTAIVDIIAREILDSRGNPTVEVDVMLEDGVDGPRRGAVGRLDRRARGGRAARRRQEPLRRQGRAQGGRGGQRRDLRRAVGGMDAEDQVAIDATHDRARRHAEQGAARRQRHPRRVARRRQGGGRGRAACRSTAMSAASSARRPAGADDEHHQRRRARRQPDRLPGIHDHAGRRADASPRRCAWAPRCSTR